MNIHGAIRQSGQRSRREQQGITGQKWGDDQPRFAKHNQEQNGVEPAAILAGQFGQVPVEMQKKRE